MNRSVGDEPSQTKGVRASRIQRLDHIKVDFNKIKVSKGSRVPMKGEISIVENIVHIIEGKDVKFLIFQHQGFIQIFCPDEMVQLLEPSLQPKKRGKTAKSFGVEGRLSHVSVE